MISNLHKNPLSKLRLTCRLIGIGGTLALAAAWWICFAGPLLAARNQLAYERNVIQSLQQNAQAITARVDQAAADAERWRRGNDQRRERSNPQHSDADFLYWVNQRAEASGLVVRDFRPSGREAQGDYQARGVIVSSHGTYEAISRFLDDLRDCPRMNRVTNLEITPRDADRKSYNFTWRVLLLAHEPKTIQPGR